MTSSKKEPRLVAWYRRHVGEPDRRTDIYLGFALFVGGVACGVVGLGLYLIEQYAMGSDPVVWARAVAFSVGALGLPVLLLGTVVLLPVDRRALYAAAGGTAVCGVAVAVFLWAYPYHWNVPVDPDYSAAGVSVYAVGLVASVAATGAALVSYHVERRGTGTPAPAEEREETVTDEQVRRDIEEAMAASEVTWGGVARDETRRIQVDVDEGGFDRSGFDGVEAEVVRSEADVDDAVAGLRRMRDDSGPSARGAGTDEQAAALQELRAEQRADADSGSLFDRLRRLVRSS